MTVKPPFFSIIIPAYNHAAYIDEALDSVLVQTWGDYEIIVIDDASSDDTWHRIIQHPAYVDVRVRCLRHTENRGAHVTLNEGIALARGTWLAILNSDDFYAPERLAQVSCAIEAEPSIAAFFSHYVYVDADSTVVRDAVALAAEFPDPQSALGPLAASFDAREIQVLALLARNYLHTTSNLICRRDVMQALGGFADWRYVHDHDFFLRLCSAYPVRVIAEDLLSYRFHGSNTISESAIQSVSETGAMLAVFMATYPLPALQRRDAGFVAVFRYLLEKISLYGSERLILLMLWAGGNDQGTVWHMLQSDPHSATWLAQGLRESIDQAQWQASLIWQAEQSETHWHEANVQREAALWQKAQTDLWWQRAITAEDALLWQRGQTDEWWRHAVELQAERDKYRKNIERFRWLGLPYGWRCLQEWINKRRI